MELLHQVCVHFTQTSTGTYDYHHHSLPIGGVAVIILVIFLHLPMEKQDLKTKLERVDYAGTAHDIKIAWGMHGYLLTC